SDPLGSGDRSATLDVVLTARFTTALLMAPVTAVVTALLCTLPSARKLPLARETSAKQTARDKTPSQIRHFLRAGEFTDGFGRDGPEAMPRGPCVSMVLVLPSIGW